MPQNVGMSEEELLNEYQKYAYEQMERNSKLDIMLTDITSTTFDSK